MEALSVTFTGPEVTAVGRALSRSTPATETERVMFRDLKTKIQVGGGSGLEAAEVVSLFRLLAATSYEPATILSPEDQASIQSALVRLSGVRAKIVNVLP